MIGKIFILNLRDSVLLYMNSYPNYLIEKYIKKSISTKFVTTNTKETVVKETKYATLPFLGFFSYELRNNVKNTLETHP